MKIRKTDIPDLDTRAKIEAALNEYKEDEFHRANIGNRPRTEHIKIRELYLSGGEFEFIDKTIDEEKAADKLEAEEKAEKEKQDSIILAKTDGGVRDLLITELMNNAGFTPDKITLAQVQESKDGKNMGQFWTDRLSKLAEIKTMITDA